jgi:hypothetical protein
LLAIKYNKKVKRNLPAKALYFLRLEVKALLDPLELFTTEAQSTRRVSTKAMPAARPLHLSDIIEDIRRR